MTMARRALGLVLLPILATAASAQEKPLKPEILAVLNEKQSSFRCPSSVAVDEKAGEWYVADQEADALVVFTETGMERTRLPVPSPIGVAVDGQGRLYVVNLKGETLLYSFQGRNEGTLAISGLPDGAVKTVAKQVAVDSSGTLYVADTGNQAVLALSPEGKFLRSFGAVGKDAKGQRFQGLNGFWVGRSKVYVVDGRAAKVSVFGKSTGDFLFEFGERGGSTGQIANGLSVVADREGRIYVLDGIRHCISIFDEEGKPIGECGGQGKSEGWFYFPKSMTLDGKGRFYVAEGLLKRVQVFTIPVQQLEKKGK